MLARPSHTEDPLMKKTAEIKLPGPGSLER